MLTVYTDRHRLRDAETELSGGVFISPHERPQRADIVLSAVRAAGLGEVIAPDAYGDAPSLAIHDADYITFLQTAWDQWTAAGGVGEALPNVWPARRMSPKRPDHIEGQLGYYALACETTLTAGTWAAADAAKDVALTAAAHVEAGARAAFGLCRPPGHHAARDMFGGYCFLNNAAIAAQQLRDRGAARVTVLDVDFHHGNGTQDIFYDRADVQFVSLHGDPMQAFPHFLGHADETGAGAGEGFTLNYPLPPGTAFDRWGAALDDALTRIDAFDPDAVIVSLGADAFERDPISFFKLTSDDFTRMGAMIARLNRPTVFVLEGGYAVAELGVNVVNTLSGFEGG